MQSIRPLKPGGRTLSGDTPHGSYHIEVYRDHDGPVYGADGELVAMINMTIKDPDPPVLTPEQTRLAADRHDACARCSAHADLTDTTVTCRRHTKICRRRKRLTDHGVTCPEGNW